MPDDIDVFGGFYAFEAGEVSVGDGVEVVFEELGCEGHVGPVPFFFLVAFGAQFSDGGVSLAVAIFVGVLGEPCVDFFPGAGFEPFVVEVVEVDVGPPVVAAGAGHGGVLKDGGRPLHGIGMGLGEVLAFDFGGTGPFAFPDAFLVVEVAGGADDFQADAVGEGSGMHGFPGFVGWFSEVNVGFAGVLGGDADEVSVLMLLDLAEEGCCWPGFSGGRAWGCGD